MFNFAIDFLEKVLSYDCNQERLYKKIKKAYAVVDFNSTLKCLVRAKIAQQLKDDAKIMICKYLDVKELQKQINQLRQEATAD